MTSAPHILSVIPPMTQLNTPYPSTAYLTGFLRSRGFHAEQTDLSIGLALQLLSADGLQAIHERLAALPAGRSALHLARSLRRSGRWRRRCARLGVRRTRPAGSRETHRHAVP